MDNVYYKREQKKVSECKLNTYVFDSDGEIAYISDGPDIYNYYTLLTMGFQHGVPGDTYVYPITLTNNMIMNDIRKLRDKYHKANIMNPKISHEIEDNVQEIFNMSDEDFTRLYDEKIDEMFNKFEERVQIAKEYDLI
jgi:two-component sensor histidine kinase